jgi:hypothetical protein
MNRSLLTFLLVLIAASIFAWTAPGPALQPGRLLAAHANLRNECLACHAIGRGVQRDKCAACHAPDGIGLRNAAGMVLAVSRPAVQGLHQRSDKVSCAVCHAEHAGRLGDKTAARFSHDRLPRDLAGDCAACHNGQIPEDALHHDVGGSCGDCHGMASWSPADFDHALLGAAPACGTCHLADKPVDDLHRTLDPVANCTPCHRTKAWKPADYDHTPWFRFDRNHPARCADCHMPGKGYQDYSCTGCHIHSPARVAAEHRKEGIVDWRNCVECHRSGDEDEARAAKHDRKGDREEGRDDD